MTKKYFAEFLGTYGLVFFGTGAIIVHDLYGGAVTHYGIAMAFGIIVAVMVYSFADVSGTHINPAVSIAFFFSKHLSQTDLFFYIIAQITGAIAASLSLHFLFPTHELLGITQPSGTAMQSFILEIILTFFLMLVVMQVALEKPHFAASAGFVIGFIVFLEALVAGPVSGASMNPARSIAPALISGKLVHLWIYILAPIIGALLAVPTWNFFRTKK